MSRFKVGDMVKLKSWCSIERKVPTGDDSEMWGCWHKGGPVVRIFSYGAGYLIRDRHGVQGWVRAVQGAQIEGI
jgi:SH3-like domain-containing protein